MGGNQERALRANFDSWKQSRGAGLIPDINPFEYYCIEHHLRDWVDSDEEIRSGLVGGSQDGGVDAMYFFVNRELVMESMDAIDPSNVVRTDLLIFQIKEGDGFSPTAIDKLERFADDLLDLDKKEPKYSHGYRPALLELMELFKKRYQELLGGGRRIFDIHFFYISGKDVDPNDDCVRSETRLKATVKKHFDKANCAFNYINTTKLWNFIESRPENKEILKWAQQPLDTPEGLVGLVNLTDYYTFVKNKENHELRERIFESNVRGFWPNSPINKEIRDTLDHPKESPEFWLLNNGITILAGDTSNAGHLQVEIHDPQIVNGLQTTRVIYDYFHSPSSYVPEGRRILVRVLKLKDDPTRDRVIRSTNNQNKMPAEALRATDPIHRQIEEMFPRFGLYYDRRKGHYKDQGKPVSKIVSMVELLQAMLSCVIGRPDHARGRPRDYFKEKPEYPYDAVFKEGMFDLNVYVRSILILRRVDSFLKALLPEESIHTKNLKFYVCLYCVCTLSQHAKIIENDILKINPDTISDDVLRRSYEKVRAVYEKIAEKHKRDNEYDYDGVAKGKDFISKLAMSLNKKYPRGPKLTIPTK